MIMPIIAKRAERPDGTTALGKKATQTIRGLLKRVNFSDFSSRMIHPFVCVLNQPNNELRMAVVDTLCALVIQLGADYAVFIPMIQKVIIFPASITLSSCLVLVSCS